MLTEDRVPAGSPMARFVRVPAYEAAGGSVLRDLLADELSTRWKWAEAMADVDWSTTARFGRIHPEPAEPTDAEKAEIERLRTRHDELANMDEDAWTDELVEEAVGIEPRLDEIEARRRPRFDPGAPAPPTSTTGMSPRRGPRPAPTPWSSPARQSPPTSRRSHGRRNALASTAAQSDG